MSNTHLKGEEQGTDKEALSLVKSYSGCSDKVAKGLLVELKALWGATKAGGGVLLYSHTKGKESKRYSKPRI